MLHTSVIELSRSALRKNLKFLRERIGKKVRFTSVIKGNAYGHGIEPFVPLAEECGVRHFAVFSADEALRVKRSTTANSDVLIMGCIDDDELEWAIATGVEFYVFELERLRAAIAAASRVGRPARIHLEVETGLRRTGLEGTDLDHAIYLLEDQAEHVVVSGVCTHFAGAESVQNYLRITEQMARFVEVRDGLRARGLETGLSHTACSAAVFAYPASIMDMVRVGIAQFGFWPSEETRMHYMLERAGEPGGIGKLSMDRPGKQLDPLRRVMEWKSRVMSVKRVPPGQFVGYGTSYMTNRTQTIAAVPVGYAHGFTRNLSNLGHVLVNGHRAGVVGVVNMNMMLVDVSDVHGVRRGDEVVIIGRQKRAHISVSSFSDLTRFLNYEVLVRLPSEIPRVVVD